MKISASVMCGIVAGFLTLGCTSEPTPYQKLGPTREGGYSDRQLSEDTFSIKFDANGDTPGSAICRYLYRRAAQVTLKNGFRYFAVIRDPCTVEFPIPTYRNEDEYKDATKPIPMNMPLGWRTCVMAIQCFHDEEKASTLHLIDARAYLRDLTIDH